MGEVSDSLLESEHTPALRAKRENQKSFWEQDVFHVEGLSTLSDEAITL